MNKLLVSLALLISFQYLLFAGDFYFIGGLPKADRIDEAEGRRRIEGFRNFRYGAGFVLDFVLDHRSRRSYGETYNGRLWANWNDLGPVVRMELWPQRGKDGERLQLLVQNGRNPQMWIKNGNGAVSQLSDSQLLSPFYKDLVYTPFDMSLRFLFWDDFSYHGPGRERSRAAHIFTMRPPANMKQAWPELREIHMAMDEKYNALLQAKYLDQRGKLLKSLIVRNFKQVQGHFIIKNIDVTDHKDRSRTQFSVIAAAMNLDIPMSTFKPEALNEAPPMFPREYFAVLGN